MKRKVFVWVMSLWVLMAADFCGAQLPVSQRLQGSEQGPVYDMAMITWRGQTPAEQGFMDYMKKKDILLRYVFYDADQNLDRLSGIISAVKKKKWDIIYVFGTTATRAVLSDIKTVPVVFNVVTRPVKTGIIKSWESSGSNATGVSSKVPVLNQLKALKKVIDYKNLAIVFNPMEPNSVIQRDIVENLSQEMNFQLHEFPVKDSGDIENMVSGLKKSVDAVFFPSDSKIKSLGKKLAAIVNELNLPSLAAMEGMVVNDSALMGLVANYYDLGALAAAKSIKILQGTPPGDIPCSSLRYFRISINMKTAQKIDIDIPTSLLVMSDNIIR